MTAADGSTGSARGKPPGVLRGRVVTDGRIIADGIVAVRADRISWVGPTSDWRGEIPAKPAVAATLLPGLIDVHCHGGGGRSFPDATADGVLQAIRHHRRSGTTALLTSLVSAPPSALLRQLDVLADAVESGHALGVHLEGPFLSAVRCGAQDPASIIAGDPGLLGELLDRGRGTVRSMTMAPETPNFHALADLLRRHGAVIGVGHTDATSRVAAAGIAAAAGGPLSATHLFNGMTPWHHRDPGPVAACLSAAARGQMVVELIADGIHLADETVAMVFDLVGPGQIALVSDAIAATGMPDGRYRLGSRDVDVRGGVARLPQVIPGERPSIAGSTSTLLDVVRRAVLHAGVDLASAVTAASATPARLLGVDAEIGNLLAGRKADIVTVNDDLELSSVMRDGVVQPETP